MLNDHRATTSRQSGQDHDDDDDEQIRDIHALTPPHPLQPQPPAGRHRRREAWETGSHRSSSLSVASEGGASSTENFTTMSREFSALVLAGSSMENSLNHDNNDGGTNNGTNNLARIGEEGDQSPEESNPLAIVLDNNPLDPAPAPRIGSASGSSTAASGSSHSEVSVQRVKKEEVEAKISAWQNAKIAKINNRSKREDAIINGWESEQVQKASSWMKKVERKLEEKRAKALEKMQNDIAKAHRKAEERRASSEAKRGTKVARVLEIANLMKAVGKAPTKRSFF